MDPFALHRSPPSRGQLKVFLRILTPSGATKLTALLASSDHAPIPLQSDDALKIVYTLLRWPLALFATMPRIFYQAYRLQWEKRLAMYPRPEPRSLSLDKVDGTEWNVAAPDRAVVGHGLIWKSSSMGEKVARRLVLHYTSTRVKGTKMGLVINFRDHREPISIGDQPEKLEISTRDPKFFTNLITAPSARHYLTIAPELLTSVSSAQAFEALYVGGTPENQLSRWAAYTRWQYFLFLLAHSLIPPTPDLMVSTPLFLASGGAATQVQVMFVTALAFFMDWLEQAVFNSLGVVFVMGRDPSKIWERALRRQYHLADGVEEPSEDIDLGSVRY